MKPADTTLMPPLVSIVIPTYNHAHFLDRALRSVMEQSYANWEAIVIDNHSQDNTDEVVNGFGDLRIKLLKIHNHGVIAASRNLGMRAAHGEWIAFLDADDCWYPRKLEIVVGTATSGDAYDVLSNDELLVDVRNGTRRVIRFGPYCSNFYRVLLLEGNRLSPSATVVRRAFLVRHGIEFDERQDYATVEDYAFWLELARNEARFKFIPEVHGEYVVHGANSSARIANHLKNAQRLLHDHVFTVQRFESTPERLWKRVAARLRLAEATRLAAASQWTAALRMALQALRDSPRATAGFIFARLKRTFGR